ncbi:MAG: FG-GAP repeat protein, partial [Burkholderiales bacterium]|nr:FG-GAP repeat protein [Burkholderiales bacterium]
DGSNGFVIGGASVGDLSGIAVSRAGDVNGDGLDDLLIGAPYAQSKAGSSYIVYGKKTPFDATLSLASLTGSNGFRLDGVNVDQAGASLAGVGDVNGDGYDDIVIGSQFAQTNAGSAYLFFGGNFTLATTLAGTSKAETLTGTSNADVISAGAGDDTVLAGGGADVIHAGAGNDTITITDLSFQLIDGGGGNDTLKLSGADLALDTINGLSHLRSIENIDINGSGNNSITLTANDVMHLSEIGNTIYITGNGGDAVHLSGAWVGDPLGSKGVPYHLGLAIVVVGLGVAVDIS